MVLITVVDAVGTTKYTYSTAGRLLTEDGPWDSDTVTSHYFNGLRTNVSLAQPDGSVHVPQTTSVAVETAKALAAGLRRQRRRHQPIEARPVRTCDINDLDGFSHGHGGHIGQLHPLRACE